MRAVLTEKLLRSLAAKGGAHEPIRDQVVRGLELRVGKDGALTFSTVARRRGGGRQPIRLRIGRYPVISLAEARNRARMHLRDLHDGIDPRVRKAEQLRAEAAERAGQFAAVAEQFIKRLEARTARAIELRVRRELIARWGDRPITRITRTDVANMVAEIADRGHREAARQTFVYARRLFRGAVARGLLDYAPTDHLDIKDLIGAKRIRQRLLTEHELRLIWRAAAEAPYPDGPYAQLLLLVGVRRSELGQATWLEIDLDRALWTIGPQRMKAGEGHQYRCRRARARFCARCRGSPATMCSPPAAPGRSMTSARSSSGSTGALPSSTAASRLSRGRCMTAGARFAPACRRSGFCRS